MGFTIPSTYPVPLQYAGAPDVIRKNPLGDILNRDRFVFAYRRRMLTSLSPFFTTNAATYDLAASMWVHNSQITSNSVFVSCYGYDADVKITINGVTTTQTLAAGPSFFQATINPGAADDSWFELKVEVQANAATGGYSGLYVYEDELSSLP